MVWSVPATECYCQPQQPRPDLTNPPALPENLKWTSRTRPADPARPKPLDRQTESHTALTLDIGGTSLLAWIHR